jgi:hypothetical protein
MVLDRPAGNRRRRNHRSGGLGLLAECANVCAAGFLLGWIEVSFEFKGGLNRFGFIVTGWGREVFLT